MHSQRSVLPTFSSSSARIRHRSWSARAVSAAASGAIELGYWIASPALGPRLCDRELRAHYRHRADARLHGLEGRILDNPASGRFWRSSASNASKSPRRAELRARTEAQARLLRLTLDDADAGGRSAGGVTLPGEGRGPVQEGYGAEAPLDPGLRRRQGLGRARTFGRVRVRPLRPCSRRRHAEGRGRPRSTGGSPAGRT